MPSSQGWMEGLCFWLRGEEVFCQSWFCSCGHRPARVQPLQAMLPPWPLLYLCHPSCDQSIHACDQRFLKCVLTFMQSPKTWPKVLGGLGPLKPIPGYQVKTLLALDHISRLQPGRCSSSYFVSGRWVPWGIIFLETHPLCSSRIKQPHGFIHRLFLKACHHVQGSGLSLLWNQA